MFILVCIGLVFANSLHTVLVVVVVLVLVAHDPVFASVYPDGVLLAVLTLLLPEQLLLLSDLLLIDRVAVVLVKILVVDALLVLLFARGRRDVTLAVVAVVVVVVGDLGQLLAVAGLGWRVVGLFARMARLDVYLMLRVGVL